MRRHLTVLLCAAIVLCCGVLAERASAANSLWGCFTAGGRAIPTSLAGLEATNKYGKWVPLNAVTVTRPNGCVSFNLWGTFTHYNLRLVTAGVTPDGQGLVLGVSRWYAPGAYGGRYYLGNWRATVIYSSLADDWLSKMGNGSSNVTAAGAVAAFSDKLGPSLNGSVLCPHSAANDSDCDGTPDNLDPAPYDYRIR
jgi:hypothetical protein